MMRDIEMQNERARQEAASSVAHKFGSPPLEDSATRL